MIKVTYLGEDFYLLDVAPAWRTGFRAEVSLMGNAETSLTNREARRGLSATLRFDVDYEILANGSDARRVAAALLAMTDERVLAPLWPAVVAWADRGNAPITGGLKLAFTEDFSWFELYEVAEPIDLPAGPVYTAPLMMGRLAGGANSRQTTWLGPELLQWEVKFTEDSPAKYAVSAGPGADLDFAIGPVTPAGQSPYLFPFEVNFANGQSEDFSLVLIREGIGFGREAAETFYPQSVARNLGTNVFVSNAPDAGRLLGFFQQHATGKSFWTSDWASAAVLTMDAGAADTVLHVSEAYPAGAIGKYVFFYGPEGVDGAVAGARVMESSPDGPTITLSQPLGVAFAAGSSMVTGLVLCRWRTPAMELQWMSGEHLEVTIPTREVSEEYDPAVDEDLATTIGKLPDRCYLYEFSRVLNTVTFTDRFTSYESDLGYGGNQYLSRKVTHGEVVGTLYLGQDEVQVKTDAFAGNPLLLPAQLASESALTVKIMEGEIDGGDVVNASVVFSGEVMSVKMSGSRITATAVAGGSMFDRKVPRAVFGVMCNASLFDDFCSANGGPTAAAYKFTAKVHDAGAPAYPFDFVLDTIAGSGASAIAALAGGAVVANYFALGWAEFRVAAGDELNWCRRAILQNTVIGGGQMTVTLKRDPVPFPAVGDTVWLYPGCDLTAATCKSAKFNNYLNFFGHPFIPVANPSMSQGGKPSGGGKK